MLSHLVRKLTAATRPAGAVVVGDRAWHLADPTAAVPDPDDWATAGRSTVVKDGRARTVWRVELPGGTVYVKECRPVGVRAWARELLRPAKARLECENAVELRRRGVAAVEPIGWAGPADGRPGVSTLVTRAVPGAVPLGTFLEQHLSSHPPAVRRAVAGELGRFIARMHDAGVVHPDPHPGNLLVAVTDGRVAFTLLDVHAVRLGRPVGWAASRANLVLYNRWFQLRASRADRARFWHAYLTARTTLPVGAATVFARWSRQVEAATEASNRRFWAGRLRRCVGSNKYFRRVTAGPVRGFAVADLPAAFVTAFAADPDALFADPSAKLLKDSRTSRVAELVIDTPAGPRAVVVKRFNVRKPVERVKNLFRRSPALRSWVVGHTLRDRDIPTPRPLVVLHRHAWGLPGTGYLLTDKVPAPAPLSAAGCPPEALARLLRLLHDRGGSHRDLKAANVLLADGQSPTFIDLVGVRVGRPLGDARRARELARLNVSFPLLPRRLKIRFLRAYLAAGPRPAWAWKQWWGAITSATAAKVARNRRTGRPLA